jgi:hypothetical protein
LVTRFPIAHDNIDHSQDLDDDDDDIPNGLLSSKISRRGNTIDFSHGYSKSLWRTCWIRCIWVVLYGKGHQFYFRNIFTTEDFFHPVEHETTNDNAPKFVDGGQYTDTVAIAGYS